MEFLEVFRMRNSRWLDVPFSFLKFCVMLWLCITLCLQLRAFHYVNEALSSGSQIATTSHYVHDKIKLDASPRHSILPARVARGVKRLGATFKPRLVQQHMLGTIVGGNESSGRSRSVLHAKASKHELGTALESRFAYVTVITRCSLVEPALVLAQNLRLSGGKADTVLISTSPNCTSDHRLSLHFSSLVTAAEVVNRYENKGFNKLLAWRLTNYSKVLYMDVDVMPLVSLDHLFSRPIPAMAPDVYAATKFNSGVMLLEPSEDIFRDMMDQLEHLPSYNGGDQGFLNSYFSDWYSLPAAHRLPAGYNAILFFPNHYHPPAWFDLNSPKSFFGPIKVVHFANPWFKPWEEEVGDADASQAPVNIWSSAWCSTKQLLRTNGWKPLTEAVEFPVKAVKDFVSQERNDGRLMLPESGTIHPPIPMWDYSVRDAFVTVATSAEDVVAAGVLAHSYNMHHNNAQNPRALHLLVLGSVAKEVWGPFKKLFAKVRMIDPLWSAGKQGEVVKALSVLQIWNQTRFDKLVYMDPYSLVMDNCNGLLEHRAFAATPSLLPADSFSTRVMVVQPHTRTFEDMLQRVREFNCSLGDAQSCLEEFLNLYYGDWYSKPAVHRISLSYAVDGWFKQGLMSYLSPWRSLVFDRRAVPWGHAIRKDRVKDRVESSIAWVESFCALTYNQRYAIAELGNRLCPKKRRPQTAG